MKSLCYLLLFLLSSLFSILTFASPTLKPASACLDQMDKYIFYVPNKDNNIIKILLLNDDQLVINGCEQLSDADIPRIAAYLLNHPGITGLDVSFNKIGLKGIKLLAKMDTLDALRINKSNIGDEEAILLATHPRLSEIELKYNHIGVAGIKAFSNNKIIEKINLDENKLDDKSIVALEKNKVLKWISLSSNKIGDVGAIALAHINSLQDLNVMANNIGSKGAVALAKNTTLTHLNLNANKLDNQAAIVFSDNNTLIDLELSLNKINDIGAFALATLPSHNSHIQILNVAGNRITGLGCLALKNAHFKWVILDGNPGC